MLRAWILRDKRKLADAQWRSGFRRAEMASPLTAPHNKVAVRFAGLNYEFRVEWRRPFDLRDDECVRLKVLATIAPSSWRRAIR